MDAHAPNNHLLEITKKVERIDVLVERLQDDVGDLQLNMSDSIKKLTEISAYVSKLLAVHDEKFEQQEKFNESILQLLSEKHKISKKDVDEVWDEMDDIKKRFSRLEKIIYGGTGIIILLGLIASNFEFFSKVLKVIL